jgi:hypothetical protein
VCNTYQDWQADRHTIWALESERGGDGIDDIIEIVVIPVATHPRGIGRISIDDGREHSEHRHQKQRENTTGEQHGVMIALLFRAVKNLYWPKTCETAGFRRRRGCR